VSKTEYLNFKNESNKINSQNDSRVMEITKKYQNELLLTEFYKQKENDLISKLKNSLWSGNLETLVDDEHSVADKIMHLEELYSNKISNMEKELEIAKEKGNNEKKLMEERYKKLMIIEKDLSKILLEKYKNVRIS
jgi:hypothetical protein